MERPVRVNGIVLKNFEAFCDYMLKHQRSEKEAFESLKRELKEFEEQYGMSSETFAETIMGTPAEDDPDFIIWGGTYRTYLRKKGRFEGAKQ